MFLRSDTSEGVAFATLSRTGGGGACIAVTGKTVIVGVWGKDVPMSNGKT